MNFDSKENCGKKSFSYKNKASIVYPNVENVIMVPNHTKNGDCYENPGLMYFIDELYLQGK